MLWIAWMHTENPYCGFIVYVYEVYTYPSQQVSRSLFIHLHETYIRITFIFSHSLHCKQLIRKVHTNISFHNEELNKATTRNTPVVIFVYLIISVKIVTYEKCKFRLFVFLFCFWHCFTFRWIVLRQGARQWLFVIVKYC